MLEKRSVSGQPRKLLTPSCAHRRRSFERSDRMTAGRRRVRQSRPCFCRIRSSLSKERRVRSSRDSGTRAQHAGGGPLKELAQGLEPGGFNEWRLWPKCATIKGWSKKNAEGLRHRERTSPTLSTGGPTRAGRQPRCGPCPIKPATYWRLSAESWNVSARP